jgi:hypothetical protein
MLYLFVQFVYLITTACFPPVVGATRPAYAISSQQPAVNPASSWQYEQKRGSDRATLRSVNAIQFAYPHVQQEYVTLGIRNRDGETVAYLEAANGLFTRSFQSGSARIQFNQQRPVTYTLSAAANGRANIVFFDKAEQLLRQLKKARSVTVQLLFAGQANRALTFQTAGLRWNH